MTIKFAEQKIHEARQRVAALDDVPPNSGRGQQRAACNTGDRPMSATVEYKRTVLLRWDLKKMAERIDELMSLNRDVLDVVPQIEDDMQMALAFLRSAASKCQPKA